MWTNPIEALTLQTHRDNINTCTNTIGSDEVAIEKSHFLSFKEVNEADCLIFECDGSCAEDDSELGLRPLEGSPVVDATDRLMCFDLDCTPWPPPRGGPISLFKRGRGFGSMGAVGSSSTDVLRLALGLLALSSSSLTATSPLLSGLGSPFTSCIIWNMSMCASPVLPPWGGRSHSPYKEVQTKSHCTLL